MTASTLPRPAGLLRRALRKALWPLHQLLLFWRLRWCVAFVRYAYFRFTRGAVRVLEPGSPGRVAPATVSHNMKGLQDLANERCLSLVRPLSCIERLDSRSRVLSVGPRTEGELLALVGHGFRPENVLGVDLISYSPWVDLGDVHDLPYADDSFDAAVVGWVLAYSEDRPQALRELVRVVRPGGLVALSFEYNPESVEEVAARLGYVPGSSDRVTSTEEVLALLGEDVGEVYFRHDVAPSRAHLKGAILLIVSVRKAEEGA